MYQAWIRNFVFYPHSSLPGSCTQRTAGHVLHRGPQETADLPTLVPPHQRPVVLLAFLRAKEPSGDRFLHHELRSS